MIKLIILILSLSQILTQEINKESNQINKVQSGIYKILHIMKSANQLSTSQDLLKGVTQLYTALHKLNKNNMNTAMLIDKLIEQQESNA